MPHLSLNTSTTSVISFIIISSFWTSFLNPSSHAEIKTDKNTALIALTHDPKIDDPAIQYALNNNFFYIGSLGSKKTHANRCKRLKESGFSNKEIISIHGPIGIKLGGKSAPEIALSIIAQLVAETYKK